MALGLLDLLAAGFNPDGSPQAPMSLLPTLAQNGPPPPPPPQAPQVAPQMSDEPLPNASLPGLLGHLQAFGTNLTTGGNPIAGLINAFGGLATGQRTDPLGIKMQTMQAIYNDLRREHMSPSAALIGAVNPQGLAELIKPQALQPGGSLVTAIPAFEGGGNGGNGGTTLAQNNNGLIDDNTAAFYAARLNKGDDSFMKGGQFSGQLGAQNKAKVMNTAVQMAQGGNQSPLDISANTMNVEGLRKTMGNIYQTNNALNTGIQHVSQLFDAFKNLGNSNFQPSNYVKNLIGPVFGATGPVNYRAVVARVAPEITRIWRGSNGAESDIERDLETLKNSLTPDQGAGALSNLAQLMESKINANQYQFESAWGPGTAKNFISPENQASLQKLRTLAQPQQSQPNAAMPQVGEIRKGHKFLGGNPADPKSWQAIQQAM